MPWNYIKTLLFPPEKMPGISHKKLSANEYMFAGASSGFFTRTVTQPLDVLKIRFQLQIEPVADSSPKSKYHGIRHACQQIYSEEGLAAFWKGLLPAQHLSVTYGAIQFVSFEFLSRQVHSFLNPEQQDMHLMKEISPLINFGCGSTAGCIATIGSFPFDTIRTRLVGQAEPKVYHGMFHGLKVMFVEEGPFSWYKGLRPTLVQCAPNAGCQFTFYKFFRDTWDSIVANKSKKASALESAICGAAAGVCAKTAVYPLDLVKKRIQIQGFEIARKKFGAMRKYTSVHHCLKLTIKEEGYLALYKGLTPSILKAAISTGSHFLCE